MYVADRVDEGEEDDGEVLQRKQDRQSRAGKRQGNAAYARDEVRRVPVTVDENGELGEEENERNQNHGVVGEVRLQGSAIREGGTVDALDLYDRSKRVTEGGERSVRRSGDGRRMSTHLGGAVEAEVGQADRPPDEETGDSGHVGEPGGGIGQEEMRQRRKRKRRTSRKPVQQIQHRQPYTRGARRRLRPRWSLPREVKVSLVKGTLSSNSTYKWECRASSCERGCEGRYPEERDRRGRGRRCTSRKTLWGGESQSQGEKKSEEKNAPADQADVRSAAFTTDGSALMPESVMAMTKGEEAAVPVERFKRGSFDATNIPTVHTPRT